VVEANEGSKNDDWQLADIKTVLVYENPDWIASLDCVAINIIDYVTHYFKRCLGRL
jgi:hypothetical protein